MPANSPSNNPVEPSRFLDVLQALLARVLIFLIRLLPIDVASAIGGWLGRTVGPMFGITRVARKNLVRAFPEKNPVEIETIIRGMWDNLGRYTFEFPHLDRIQFNAPDARAEIAGVENTALLRDDDAPGIFISGHMANWELASRSVTNEGVVLHGIYRAPNNPHMEPIFTRQNPGRGELLPKGAKGAKRAIQLLKTGGHLGILVDQKMNDGVAVPFFGRDAMTAPAVAQFAYRYKCPIVPVRVERLGGARFRITHHAPIDLPDTGDRHADILQTMTDINALLEGWVRERPEQWFWVHRRWPD